MSSSREQIPPRRKRQRTDAGLSLDDPSELQPSKRLKSSTKLHSTAFFDSLTKVWLTRRALKELDRRTNQVNSPQRPASTPRRAYREDTSKHIQRFARHGGPELRDLRGYLAPTDVELARKMSSSRSSQSGRTQSTRPTSTLKTRRSSAYDNDFEQHLTDHHIYIYNRNSKPGNLESLHQKLSQPRPSLSPSRFSNKAFEDFQEINYGVTKEDQVMRDVVPIMCGNADIPSRQDHLFTRLDPIANGTTVDAKPDFYDGARLEDIDKQVRQDLGSYIIPTGHATNPVAPNFFLEVKRPNGGADVAKRQACYDGALGARGIRELQSYGEGKPVYDNNAYTITSTYHDGQLKMYTTHPTQSVDGTPEYHMTQIRALALVDTPDSFRQGATIFRNARDWTQEQRNRFISAANERARSTITGSAHSGSSDHNYASDVTYNQDTTYLVQADLVDDSQYHTSHQVSQGEYLGNDLPTFESSAYNYPVTSNSSAPTGYSSAYSGPIVSDSSAATGYSSAYNDPSDTKDAYPIEAETSADELALDTYPESTTPHKRRHWTSEKASKAPRHSGGESRRRRSKR